MLTRQHCVDNWSFSKVFTSTIAMTMLTATRAIKPALISKRSGQFVERTGIMAETVANIAVVALIAAAFTATALAAVVANARERSMVLRPIPVEARSRRPRRDY
jgi:hypothetical protein